jgi:hypothetical protein
LFIKSAANIFDYRRDTSKKEDQMKKKKLNLEISEIGPIAEKLNLVTGLPGPCGGGEGANNSTGPTGWGIVDAVINHPGNNAVVSAALGTSAATFLGTANPPLSVATGLAAGAASCIACHGPCW